jgi:CRP/FNR family transcriptional regulator, cyclic AMP receptor protein
VRRDQYLEHLSEVPMFRALSKKDLSLVARLAEDYQVDAGQVLTREGKRESQFYLIVGGKAKVTRGKRTVATLGPGDYFGELALLDPGPRNATVTAQTDMEVLELGSREFGGLLEEVPTIARKLLAGLARRLHEADARLS